MSEVRSMSESSRQTQERHCNWVEEMRSREPSETDLRDILELRSQGYKPAFIASALEFHKPVLQRILRKLDRATKS